MSMRYVVRHPHYVCVVCTATCYLGIIVACALHCVVYSTTATWEQSGGGIMALCVSAAAWYHDNHADEQRGTTCTSCSSAVLLAVVLAVLSEVALFISVLWTAAILLLAHSAYCTQLCTVTHSPAMHGMRAEGRECLHSRLRASVEWWSNVQAQNTTTNGYDALQRQYSIMHNNRVCCYGNATRCVHAYATIAPTVLPLRSISNGMCTCRE